MRLLQLAAFILASFSAALAQGQTAPTRALEHAEALRLATERNIGLVIDRMERELRELDAREARVPYVPVFFIEPEVQTAANYIVRPPERTDRASAGAGVRWNTTFGTSLALRALTTPWYTGFPPIPLTTLETSINQPLLRDAWGNGNLLGVVDLAVDLQRAIFVGQLNDLLVRVEEAYWELAYAQADVDIKQLSLERAREQFEDTRENIKRGLLAPGDIFVVEENVVIFEEQLLRSNEALALAQLRLGRLLQLEDANELVAADGLDQPEVQLPTSAAALATAMHENPTIVAQRVAVEQARLRHAYDANQSRPVLDLSAGVSLNGLSEDYGTAWEETLGADNPALRVGLYFELPLVGGPYRARVQRADLARQQELERLEEAESDVTYEIEALLTQLRTRIQALSLAQRRIELAENKLATERDKYLRGLSTLTDVVRFQRDVDAARISERRARVDVIVLRAELARAQGVLYRFAGIDVP